MADAVNAHQRNLYQKKFFHLGYVDGTGVTYNNQLRTLSWPIASDLPSHAQRSADDHQDAYDTLHPMKFTQNRAQFESSFANSYGSFGMQLSAEPTLPVHERLYNPSRAMTNSYYKNPVSNTEVAADQAFSEGRYRDAIKGFDQAIRTKASLFVYEKRCAALAHVGRYEEALGDARFVLANGPKGETESGPARARVKALEDFISKKANYIKGYTEAPATLMCLLTPRDVRQWRSKTPATYNRPYPFGVSGTLALSGLLSGIDDADSPTRSIPKY